MSEPFHKRKIEDWYSALQTEDGSKSLLQELIQNCGTRAPISIDIHRGRLNLMPDEISASLSETINSPFDSPPFEKQQNGITKSRFQPKTINCMYAAYALKTAVLEALPGYKIFKDVIYVATMIIKKPLKLLDLTNFRHFSANGECVWDYIPIFRPMFLNEAPFDPLIELETSCLLSEFAYRQNLDGIIYPSRSELLAGFKQNKPSHYPNYVIYGSPIKECKISPPRTVKIFHLKEIKNDITGK